VASGATASVDLAQLSVVATLSRVLAAAAVADVRLGDLFAGVGPIKFMNARATPASIGMSIRAASISIPVASGSARTTALPSTVAASAAPASIAVTVED
jgi:hypothetical protein